ncbi:MAG TPA: ABC transporter permease [Alphaproteobacteria bacterium]|nr:ABC transporter permease [Alphaproteobacteria bacterium]
MLRYLASRLVTTLIVTVGAIALLLSLTLIIPGDPATILLGPRATPELVAALTQRMGLDLPLHLRLVHFFGDLLRGDLGEDILSGRPVAGLVLAALPNTVMLAVSAIGLAVLIGVPLGCYAATHPGSFGDQVAAFISVGFISTPSFVIAIFLLLIFSVSLHWLPVMGAGDAGDPLDQLQHLVLPSLALAAGWIGYIARLIRSSLLEVLGEPFIRTSRAYGIAERAIVYKYALKLACIPTLAVLGVGVGELLGGAVFAEIIFNRPGLGSLIYKSILDRNYPVVQGSIFIVVLLFVLTNLLVDLSYAWLDPRTRDSISSSFAPWRQRART